MTRSARPCVGDATLRVDALLGRDRRGGHAAAVLARGVEREAAPARPDLEQVVVRPELEQRADPVELDALRVGERLVAGVEDRGRVHHRLGVEEGLEHLVAEVVVGGDVVARAAPRVAAAQRRQALGRKRQRSEAVAQRVEPADLPRADPQDARRGRRCPTSPRRSCGRGRCRDPAGRRGKSAGRAPRSRRAGRRRRGRSRSGCRRASTTASLPSRMRPSTRWPIVRATLMPSPSPAGAGGSGRRAASAAGPGRRCVPAPAAAAAAG